jgi:hypothetical protein
MPSYDVALPQDSRAETLGMIDLRDDDEARSSQAR